MSHNITVTVQTPIGEVHAECSVTPPERRGFGGGKPAIDPPDPGEAEVTGDVWICVASEDGGPPQMQSIDDPAAILFWTPSLIIGGAPGPQQPARSTDRQDIRNYTSLDQMIVDKAMEEA